MCFQCRTCRGFGAGCAIGTVCERRAQAARSNVDAILVVRDLRGPEDTSPSGEGRGRKRPSKTVPSLCPHQQPIQTPPSGAAVHTAHVSHDTLRPHHSGYCCATGLTKTKCEWKSDGG